MSLFDKAVVFLDRVLATPTPAMEDETGHMALLRESSRRVESTLHAIQEGELIAPFSATENRKVADELRYEANRLRKLQQERHRKRLSHFA